MHRISYACFSVVLARELTYIQYSRGLNQAEFQRRESLGAPRYRFIDFKLSVFRCRLGRRRRFGFGHRRRRFQLGFDSDQSIQRFRLPLAKRGFERRRFCLVLGRHSLGQLNICRFWKLQLLLHRPELRQQSLLGGYSHRIVCGLFRPGFFLPVRLNPLTPFPKRRGEVPPLDNRLASRISLTLSQNRVGGQQRQKTLISRQAGKKGGSDETVKRFPVANRVFSLNQTRP